MKPERIFEEITSLKLFLRWLPIFAQKGDISPYEELSSAKPEWSVWNISDVSLAYHMDVVKSCFWSEHFDQAEIELAFPESNSGETTIISVVTVLYFLLLIKLISWCQDGHFDIKIHYWSLKITHFDLRLECDLVRIREAFWKNGFSSAPAC